MSDIQTIASTLGLLLLLSLCIAWDMLIFHMRMKHDKLDHQQKQEEMKTELWIDQRYQELEEKKARLKNAKR
jgi:hypothetical protein